MPLKQKQPKYHKAHHKERHSKAFLKAYAPYLPLIVMVGLGLFLSTFGNISHQSQNSEVLGYSSQISDNGLLEATNKTRSEHNLSNLTHNKELDKAAQAKADDMVKRNYWSHNTPDGNEPWTFIDNTHYSYLKAAENLAYGFNSSNSVVSGWLNSASHRANLLDNNLSEVGFGVANAENFQGKGNETIVVAMYGLPSPEVLASQDNKSQLNVASEFAKSSSSLSANANISYAQLITGGKMPWITIALGFFAGLCVMYLGLKHARGIKKSLSSSEQFIMKHPLLDATLVAFVALVVIVSQSAGFIH